jgi:FlaG/FlaF family flagellin (archaellin)
MPRKSLITAVIVAAAVPVGLAGAASTTLRASLNGSSEVPKTTSKAAGTGQFTVASDGKSIRYRLTASGLSGTPQAAHLHLGNPGQAGGVMISIATKPFSLPRTGRLTASQFSATGSVKTFAQAIRAVRAGRTYVNIHTLKFPAGEIRGQVRVRR